MNIFNSGKYMDYHVPLISLIVLSLGYTNNFFMFNSLWSEADVLIDCLNRTQSKYYMIAWGRVRTSVRMFLPPAFSTFSHTSSSGLRCQTEE